MVEPVASLDEPVSSLVPVSVRTPEEMGTFGNRVSTMIAELPIDEADPVARLHRARTTMTAAKRRHQSLPPSLLEDANDLIPPAAFARATGSPSTQSRVPSAAVTATTTPDSTASSTRSLRMIGSAGASG